MYLHFVLHWSTEVEGLHGGNTIRKDVCGITMWLPHNHMLFLVISLLSIHFVLIFLWYFTLSPSYRYTVTTHIFLTIQICVVYKCRSCIKCRRHVFFMLCTCTCTLSNKTYLSFMQPGIHILTGHPKVCLLTINCKSPGLTTY